MVASTFATLFLDLQDYLKGKFPAWHIDHDFGQMDFDMRPPVNFPCLLLDFGSTQYSNAQHPYQIGQSLLVCRIIFAPFEQANDSTPLEYKEQALKFYELEQEVVFAIHDFDKDYVSKLVRTQALSERRNDELRLRQVHFTFAFKEYASNETTTEVKEPVEPVFVIGS